MLLSWIRSCHRECVTGMSANVTYFSVRRSHIRSSIIQTCSDAREYILHYHTNNTIIFPSWKASLILACHRGHHYGRACLLRYLHSAFYQRNICRKIMTTTGVLISNIFGRIYGREMITVIYLFRSAYHACNCWSIY